MLAVGRLWWLPAHASLNVNEGWNAGHVARAMGAGPLYPDPQALIANNYPPLSFFTVGWLSRSGGDPIVIGRLLSLASELAVAGAIGTIVRRLSVPQWGVVAALLFGGTAVTLLRNYLAMNDPQWFAQALICWALVLLVPASTERSPDALRVVAAAALTVAGALVKHNLVALPAAVTLWLLLIHPRAFWIWAGAGLCLAAVSAAALFAIWGTAVFSDVLAPARSYSGLRLLAHGAPLLLFALPGLLASRPLLAAWRRDTRLLLPVLMVAFALPVAILQRSGDGVDVNAIFETAVALSIAVPLGCSLRAARSWTWLGLAALPMLVLVPVAATSDWREVARRDAEVRRWQPFIARLAAEPRPVACDDQAPCHWARRQSALDFFAIKQRLLKGDVPQLREALDTHAFGLIVMRSENPGWHENRLVPAIRARYRTIYRSGDHEMLVPR